MLTDDDITRSYINTALWSSTCDPETEEAFLDESHDIYDIDKETLVALDKELKEFIEKYYYLIDNMDKDKSKETFAHNFWLTRNGHGAGFWDGDYKNGKKLTNACEGYPIIDLYVGDDGKIYK